MYDITPLIELTQQNPATPEWQMHTLLFEGYQFTVRFKRTKTNHIIAEIGSLYNKGERGSPSWLLYGLLIELATLIQQEASMDDWSQVTIDDLTEPDTGDGLMIMRVTTTKLVRP